MEQVTDPLEIEDKSENKKKTYTPAVRNAIYRYRSKNVDKYNESQRNYYDKAKTDEEWKKKFNERCKINNDKYREKKKQLLGENVRPRGRPRKVTKPAINDLQSICEF
jgi:hypothetical protein